MGSIIQPAPYLVPFRFYLPELSLPSSLRFYDMRTLSAATQPVIETLPRWKRNLFHSSRIGISFLRKLSPYVNTPNLLPVPLNQCATICCVEMLVRERQKGQKRLPPDWAFRIFFTPVPQTAKSLISWGRCCQIQGTVRIPPSLLIPRLKISKWTLRLLITS